MVLRQLICVLIILQIIAQSYAQQPLPMPRNLEITFEKGTRSKDGRPGRNYWQNKADYTLNVNFDPVTRQLTGSETIEYSNNSPDTLSEIWFKLYPNLYKRGSPRSRSISNDDVSDGVKISSMAINSITQDSSKLKIDGTNMQMTCINNFKHHIG